MDTNICPKCNETFDQSKKFCGKCGVPLVMGNDNVETESSTLSPNTAKLEAPLVVPKSHKTKRNIALWLVVSLIFIIAIVYYPFNHPKTGQESLIFSDFISYVEKGQVREVTIQGENITGILATGKRFKTSAPADPELIPLLKEKGVRISAKPADSSWFMTIFNQPKVTHENVIFSDFISYVDKGQVQEVIIQGENITGKLGTGKSFKTFAPQDPELIPLLKGKGVRIIAKPTESSWFMTIFNQPKTDQENLIFSDFISYVGKGQVSEVTIQGENITGKLATGKSFKTFAPADPELIPLLKSKGVRILAKPDR